MTVTATSQADTSKSAPASVTLQPVAVSVSPASASLGPSQTQQFTATVTGSSITTVTWSISPSVGSISGSGLYTAPASITSQQTVTVKATSNADTTKSASATVTLVPPITVTVSPASVTLGVYAPSQSQQFTATVTGATNTNVTWSCSCAVGSFSSSGSTATYTAPATNSSQHTVTITATSVANPAKSASATVTVAAYPAAGTEPYCCFMGQANCPWCGTVCLNPAYPICGPNGTPHCVNGSVWCSGTPIIIDPQGQGFHLTSVANGVKFKFALPQAQQTSWTDANYANAWLVLDRNGNGVIDDATELFGDLTPQPAGPNPNGYKALAVFDDPKNGGNGNGMIDPGDSVYSKLRLWVDKNHNGISEPGELYTLPQAGVFAISLKYTSKPYTDQYGNQFRYQSMIFDKSMKSSPLMYDVILMIQPPPQQ